jgi:hypothetical protein
MTSAPALALAVRTARSDCQVPGFRVEASLRGDARMNRRLTRGVIRRAVTGAWLSPVAGLDRSETETRDYRPERARTRTGLARSHLGDSPSQRTAALGTPAVVSARPVGIVARRAGRSKSIRAPSAKLVATNPGQRFVSLGNRRIQGRARRTRRRMNAYANAESSTQHRAYERRPAANPKAASWGLRSPRPQVAETAVPGFGSAALPSSTLRLPRLERQRVGSGVGNCRVPIEVGIWRIDGGRVDPVPASSLERESRLEDVLEQDVSILGLDSLLVIGRQVITKYGKRVDLLAVDVEGSLFVIELKKDRTPREVVAQALDYGFWVRQLG